MSDADLRQLERVDRQRWLVERYRRGIFTRDDLRPGDRVVCVQYWSENSHEDLRKNDPRNGMAGVVVSHHPSPMPNAHDVRVYFDDRDYTDFKEPHIPHLVKPEGA